MIDIGSALAFTIFAGFILFVFFYLLHFIWDRGEKGDTWWWNFFMRLDGPFLGTWPERVAWFQGRHAAQFGVRDPRTVMRSDGKLPAPDTSITTYWEKDNVPDGIPSGWWRMWNNERKNLALVVERLLYTDGSTADRVWWSIFSTYLWPEFSILSEKACYQLVDDTDLIRIGLQPAYGYYDELCLEGWSDTVEEAKEQVESIIDYIWEELPVIRPETETQYANQT